MPWNTIRTTGRLNHETSNCHQGAPKHGDGSPPSPPSPCERSPPRRWFTMRADRRPRYLMSPHVVAVAISSSRVSPLSQLLPLQPSSSSSSSRDDRCHRHSRTPRVARRPSSILPRSAGARGFFDAARTCDRPRRRVAPSRLCLLDCVRQDDRFERVVEQRCESSDDETTDARRTTTTTSDDETTDRRPRRTTMTTSDDETIDGPDDG